MKKTILGILVALLLGLNLSPAFAQESTASDVKITEGQIKQRQLEVYTNSASPTANYMYAISAAAAIAIAAAFGALSQSRAASTALDAIGRNPGAAGKIQTPMIIALALIESLIIYALVIAFLLQSKIAVLPSV